MSLPPGIDRPLPLPLPTPRGVALCDQITALLRDQPVLTPAHAVHHALRLGDWTTREIQSALSWLQASGRVGHAHGGATAPCWWWAIRTEQDYQAAIAVREIERCTDQKGHGT